MSKKVENELLKIYPNCNCKKLFLPIITDNKTCINSMDAKIKIGLSRNKVTFLFFGLIRQYKGLDILLSAINNIDENLKDNFECMIVGESYENINHYKSILKENVSANILWVNDYVSDDKVDLYFSAADYVVLPYKTASQSAIIPMAYYYNTPVIISDLDGLKEFVDNNKTGFVFPALDIIKLTDILNMVILNNNSNEMFLQIEKIKKKMSTKEFSKEVISFIS